MMTSRGCPYKCEYCHISKENEGSRPGNIRRLRLKSVQRVSEEIDVLAELGVDHIFLEDDSLLAERKRAFELFGEVRK